MSKAQDKIPFGFLPWKWIFQCNIGVLHYRPNETISSSNPVSSSASQMESAFSLVYLEWVNLTQNLHVFTTFLIVAIHEFLLFFPSLFFALNFLFRTFVEGIFITCFHIASSSIHPKIGVFWWELTIYAETSLCHLNNPLKASNAHKSTHVENL
ncbi:UNVERIFIED_CONTAM: hypothetical protein NCL1_24087 [Trichonephila clavipes]